MAIDQDTGMLFALKTVPVAGSRGEVAELLKCLRQEVVVLTGVQHPNVVQCYGVTLDCSAAGRERINIAMEYVEGGSLASLLHEFGPLPSKVVAAYARQMVLGLEYLHARGVVHGDVKPGNVLIDKQVSECERTYSVCVCLCVCLCGVYECVSV
jgi:serine/threonine protein kinase